MRNYTILKAVIVALLLSFVTETSAQKRIRIYPSIDRDELIEKMESVPWAKATLTTAHREADKYVEIHQTDTTWIISRMQMYWKNQYDTPYVNGNYYSRGEGHALVPTVRFTGARDWTSDHNTPSLEDVLPYMNYRDDEIYLQNRAKEGKPWEWIHTSKSATKIEKINEGIMNKAMYSAFLYFLTDDVKYAKFSYDILKTFADGIYYRNAPVTEVDHRNADVVGLTSFEVIHEGVVPLMALCYDFLGDYFALKGLPTDTIHAAMKKYADQIVVNGKGNNNWNIIQARFVSHIALVLDSDSSYEDGKGREYYVDILLNKVTDSQRALNAVRDIYDPYTAMWNESPIYSTHSTKDLLETLLLIDGIENKNILTDFEVVERAPAVSMEYEMPNNITVAFGDNGYSYIEYTMYETLLALYTKYGLTQKANDIMAILNEKIEANLYDRTKGSSMYKLFNYVAEIDPNVTNDRDFFSAMLHVPTTNLTLLRNGLDRENGLMLTNAATGHGHANKNGINLELYGKGYALGIDKGRGGSYWVDNHSEYYNTAVGHNTVVVDGVSINTSPRMEGDVASQHTLRSSFPLSNQKDAHLAPSVSYVDNEYHELSTNSLQRRVCGIVRTSPTSGYYVDIFRSRRQEGGDKTHEYIYHNVGQTLTFVDESGAEIPMSPTAELTSEGGKHKGYDYLSDKYEACYDNNFRATFTANVDQKDDVSMDVWMRGDEQRTIFSVKTPRLLNGYLDMYDKNIDTLRVPAIILRQSGEAWSRPFVAIYEPYKTDEGRTISSVKYHQVDDSEAVVVEVNSLSGGREMILSNTANDECLKLSDIAFEGAYGVVSTQGSELRSLFVGDGSSISSGECKIFTDNQNSSVFVEWASDGVVVEAYAPFVLEMPKTTPSILEYRDRRGGTHVAKGRIVKTSGGKRMRFEISATM
ncbi:MAG: hypothetical protein SNG02_01935 [Rikenellaceae bacterium]